MKHKLSKEERAILSNIELYKKKIIDMVNHSKGICFIINKYESLEEVNMLIDSNGIYLYAQLINKLQIEYGVLLKIRLKKENFIKKNKFKDGTYNHLINSLTKMGMSIPRTLKSL